MTKIYEQFDAATRNICAYAILKDGEPIGRVVLKYPKDGAGRLYAYVQVYGAPMVRGWAGGYGYDKATAAVSGASTYLRPDVEDEIRQGIANCVADFKRLKDSGYRWDNQLEGMGYRVVSVTG